MDTVVDNNLFPTLLTACLCAAGFLGLWLFTLRQGRRLRQRLRALEAQLQEKENALVQARRMEAVGILAGSIVHNLNNLLAVILGHTRMAINSADQGSPLREDLERVTKAGHMASDLVQEISDFYRQADQAHKPTDLVPVVRDTLKLLQDILPPTVEIRQQLPQRCGPVMASATGVQQILMNLFSNSVHAIHRRQGIIEVSLSEEKIEDWRKAFPQELGPGSYVKLRVSDNGRGMDAATLDRIFTSYFSASERGRGMGIGLSTVHRILLDHDGVTIPHSAPGRGTSFDIFFPLIAWRVEQPSAPPLTLVPGVETPLAGKVSTPEAAVAAEAPTTAGATNEAASGAGITVLLVDDQDMVAQVTTRGLQRQGFRVITHTDSRRALDEFIQAPETFDVVVTDQIMPNMSGVRLTKKIHGVRPDIPVILVTGFRDSFNEQQAREAGVTEFLLKPASHRDLTNLIRRVLLRRMEGKG